MKNLKENRKKAINNIKCSEDECKEMEMRIQTFADPENQQEESKEIIQSLNKRLNEMTDNNAQNLELINNSNNEATTQGNEIDQLNREFENLKKANIEYESCTYSACKKYMAK